MAESITFDVLVRDRASAQFDKIARSTSTLESRFAKFTATARNVATGLVGAEIGKSVLDAADAFETSRSRLESVTQNIGANFQQISAQVDAADKSMAAFGFTSADTEGALATLEAVTKNPAKALGDLALAADIARGRNIGLSESVSILSRIETGHVAMLSRLGIATKDAAGHTLTQAQALQMLTQLYGGAASRYADTFAGKQAAVRAEMKNSAAEIGVALLPAAVDLAKVIQQDVLPPIVSLAQWLDRNRHTIEPLAKALIIAVGAWKAYKIATEAAAAANLLFARSAVGAEAGALGAGAAASRGRLLGFGGALAGGAAIYAGQKAGGQTGSALTSTGVGAIGGSLFGPVGAAVGAAGGLSYGLTTNVLHDFFGDPSKKGKGTAQFGADFQKQVDALGGVDKALAHYRQLNAQTAITQRALTTAMDGTAAAARRTAAQIEAAARKNLNLSGAQDALREAFQQAAQTAADSGRALTGNSDAALANRDAVRQEANAIFAVIDAMKAHGASASAQATELGILERALEINATKTYGDKAAVDALLRSLGLIPDAVSAAATALAALNPVQQALLNSDTPSKGAIQQLNAGVAKAKAQAATTGKQVAESFTAGYTPVVAKGAEKAAKTAANAAVAAFKAAKDKMLSDVDTIRQALTSTQQQFAGFADFTAQGTDALGASGANSDVAGQLKAKASRLEQFARLFNQLDRLHLDPHLMAQFAQIGPDAIPAMQALVHQGARGIKAVNRIESRIQAASASVARTETKEQDSGLIHQDLLKLPTKLSREFVKDLRTLHLSVSLKESDWKQGKGVLVSP